MRVDFNEIKTKISLPDFLQEHFGWHYDRGSSPAYPKMSSPNNDRTIVIKRNSQGVYTYFDVHDDSVKGKTILDFMQGELQHEGKTPTLREVGEVLQNYIKEGKTVLPELSKMGNLDRELWDEEKIIQDVKNLTLLKDYSFIESRGIDRETIESPVWKNVLRQNNFFDMEKKISYRNTCILLQNSEGIQGYSQRNMLFKGAIGNRFDAIAASSFDKKRPIDILYIGESWVDCISHYQLNKTKDNVLYLSSEGNFTCGQMNTINKILDRYDVHKIISIFDNDLQGQSYTLRLAGKLNVKENGYEFEAITSKKDKRVFVELTIAGDNKQRAEQTARKLFPVSMIEKYYDCSELKLAPKSVSIHDGSFRYEISFPYIKEILTELSSHIMECSSGKKIKMELPKNKDFSDDLQEIKGIEKKHINREFRNIGHRNIFNDRYI